MVIDWLAAGVDPGQATLFIQSRVPEHAELHLLLSMMTPLGWLERVPTYKDQQEKLSNKDLSTYGFLGYPLLQSADILIYRANQVPVGEDQVPHIEFTREIARRFNHLYGREPGFEDKARERGQEAGQQEGQALRRTAHPLPGAGRRRGAGAGARHCSNEQQNLSLGDRERLFGYLEGGGKMILAEPDALLTAGLAHAGAGRAENVQVLQQHHHPARRCRERDQEDPHHADRPGARAPHRSGRPGEVPGLAVPSWSIPNDAMQANGCSRAAAAPVSAASNASSR